MPQHFADDKKLLIAYLHKKGLSDGKIALEVSCSKTEVNGMMKSWKETGKFFERAGTGRGRKRKSSKHQDRVLVRFSLVNRHFTSSDM